MLNKKTILLISALFMPAVAFSADAVVQDLKTPVMSQDLKAPQMRNDTAEKIAGINERLAVLTAELAELEMKAKVAEKNLELKKALNPAIPAYYSDSFVPSVDYIDAVDGKYKASLYVQGGNTQSVRVGDKVGAWTVKQIKMDSVAVQKGKEVVYLGFGSYNPSQDIASTQNGLNGQVPVIPR
jgi:type IV pilus biogenesis protein PilP